MKRIFINFFFIVFVTGMLCSSCNDDSGGSSPNVEKVVLDSSCLRMNYSIGEKLDLFNLKVQGIFSDGSLRDLTDYTTVPVNETVLDTVGTNTISVLYGGKSAEFNIVVYADTGFTVSTVYEIYSDINDLLVYDEEKRQLTAISGFESYRWYVDDKKQDCTISTFPLPYNGTCTVMVIVAENGKNYSASYRIEF